ncbi:hypothetical protein A2U01_0072954, partial [Trifolium medium]|nr:hypothetical protein [Trifolium medium]
VMGGSFHSHSRIMGMVGGYSPYPFSDHGDDGQIFSMEG